jgi:hypothetical protein
MFFRKKITSVKAGGKPLKRDSLFVNIITTSVEEPLFRRSRFPQQGQQKECIIFGGLGE